MRYCTRCGRPLKPGAMFCTNCGAPAASGTPNDAPGTAVPPAPGAPTVVGAAGAATVATVADRARRRLIIMIVAAVAVIAVVAAGIVTKGFGAWSERQIPQFEASAKADDVAAKLEGSGIHLKRTKVYGAAKKGDYLRLDGHTPGERIDRDETVTVVESLGPGVPKGTVGLDEDKAIDRVRDMGVRVVTVEVPSEQDGKVIATMPQEDHPVVGKGGDRQIALAVGSGSTKGIPFEIAGMDKDKAKQRLESKGYDVTLTPMMADKAMTGKIADADPGIGATSDETDVTLYYGATPDEVKQAMLVDHDESAGNEFHSYDDLRILLGDWCTDGGDCITLVEDQQNGPAVDYVRSVQIQGRTDAQFGLGACPFSQGVGMCDPINTQYSQSMMHSLIAGDSGAFEIYDSFAYAPWCGTRQMGGAGSWCDHGTPTSEYPDGDFTSSGLEYRMGDFLVVVPAGADIKKLEADGYFVRTKDGDVKEPDTTRPYLLIRDPSLYDETTASADGTHPRNPFVYDSATENKKLVPFAPAPSEQVAYYKVQPDSTWLDYDNNETMVCQDGGCPPKTK